MRAERNIFAQLVLLSLQHDIDSELTMSYQFGPVPCALATADRSPAKSKLLHNLEGNVVPSKNHLVRTVSTFVTGNRMQFCRLLQVFQKHLEMLPKVFNVLHRANRVDFVTDSYHPNSIKSFERYRRGSPPTFLLSGPMTKTPREWKSFMSNGKNKTQLIKLLLSEWQKPKFAERLHGRDLFFTCGEQCYHLTSINGREVPIEPEEELFSSQEEADTRIILDCDHVSQNFSETTVIIVRSPDTDVLVLLSKFSQNISQLVLFDTGLTGNKRRLLKGTLSSSNFVWPYKINSQVHS